MRNVSVVLIMIFMVLGNFASAATKFSVHLPWSFIQEKIKAEFIKQSMVQQMWPEISFQASGITWSARQIGFAADLSQSTVNVSADNISVQTPTFGAAVTFYQLVANQVITRNVGGILLQVRFQATCGPIQLRQTAAKSSMNLKPSWSAAAPDLQVSSLDIQWPESSWQVTDFNCVGPQGITDAVKTEIKNYLKSPAFAQAKILEMVRGSIQQGLLKNIIATANQFPVKIGGVDQNMKVIDTSAQATGLFALASSDPSSTEKLDAEVMANASLLPNSGGPSVLSTIDDMKTLYKASTRAADDVITVDMQKVPAFHDLMQDPVSQSWGWPDLQNYPKDSPFFANVPLPASSDITMSLSSNVITAKMNIKGVIQSYRGGQWWNYVPFSGPIQASVTMKFTKGLMTYSTNVTSSTLKFAFGADYAAKYKNLGSLPTSNLNSGFQGVQKSLSGQVQWPAYTISSTRVYQASQMKKLSNRFSYIQWTATTP